MTNQKRGSAAPGPLLQGTLEPDPSATTVDPGLRPLVFLSVNSILKICELLKDHLGDDLESVMIYLTVAHASLHPVVTNPELAARYEGKTVPQMHLNPISRRIIAASTRLPRETVRRKVNKMVAGGLLAEDAHGRVSCVSGTLALTDLGVLVRKLDQVMRQHVEAAARLARSTGETAATGPLKSMSA